MEKVLYKGKEYDHLPKEDYRFFEADPAKDMLLIALDGSVVFTTKAEIENPKKLIPDEIVLSADQQMAYDYIFDTPIEDKALFFFLTGEAGTGKTTLVNYIKKRHECRLTASTGLASQHIGGTTIFRFLGIRPENVENNVPASIDVVRKRLGSAKVVFLDEVSMVDTKLFKLIVEALVYYKIRVILVGDFFQLPPVSGAPCFTSVEWNMVRAVGLTKNHRQDQASDLAKSLNYIRWGHVDEYMKALMLQNTVVKLPDDCVNIMPFRARVMAVNNKRLNALGTTISKHKYKVITLADKMTESKVVGLINQSRIPAELELAIGARVICLTNDGDNRWVNGSLGWVEAIHQHHIKVRMDRLGMCIDIPLVNHEITDADGKILAVYTQFPVDLAWAMTIHKAQGTTLDKIGIDLSNHFAPGMTYVALSRCKNAEGIKFVGTMKGVLTDQRVIDLYTRYAGK